MFLGACLRTRQIVRRKTLFPTLTKRCSGFWGRAAGVTIRTMATSKMVYVTKNGVPWPFQGTSKDFLLAVPTGVGKLSNFHVGMLSCP